MPDHPSWPRAELPFRKLNANRLHDALDRALEPQVTVNATVLADLLATEVGVVGAADALVGA